LRYCLVLLLLIAMSGCASQSPPAFKPQIAFLNHGFAVLDQQTADAIENSAFLHQFANFTIRTTDADGGEHWKGRYLFGRQTYLELFGPIDGGGNPGSTGVALSPDREGGLVTLKSRLSELGVSSLDSGQRTRQLGSEQLPWFAMVNPHDDPDALAVWGMEYLPGFMNDPRNEKRPARGQDDVISRARALGDGYQQYFVRDISAVEIAATERDVSTVRPIFVAAGFIVDRQGRQLIAHDGQATVTLDIVAQQAASLRRIDFVLNRWSPRHIEQLGHSKLIVGPGLRATWIFDRPSDTP
jgi:Family of unknown function (DUF5829)